MSEKKRACPGRIDGVFDERVRPDGRSVICQEGANNESADYNLRNSREMRANGHLMSDSSV